MRWKTNRTTKQSLNPLEESYQTPQASQSQVPHHSSLPFKASLPSPAQREHPWQLSGDQHPSSLSFHRDSLIGNSQNKTRAPKHEKGSKTKPLWPQTKDQPQNPETQTHQTPIGLRCFFSRRPDRHFRMLSDNSLMMVFLAAEVSNGSQNTKGRLWVLPDLPCCPGLSATWFAFSTLYPVNPDGQAPSAENKLQPHNNCLGPGVVCLGFRKANPSSLWRLVPWVLWKSMYTLNKSSVFFWGRKNTENSPTTVFHVVLDIMIFSCFTTDTPSYTSDPLRFFLRKDPKTVNGLEE